MIKQQVGRWVYQHMPITRFLFDQNRLECNALLRRVTNMASPWQWQKFKALQRQKNLLVNVACGPQVLDEFVNVDLFRYDPAIYAWDCRKSLPLADESAAGIRAEHFVEHLEPREELPSFLSDCRRTLEPGGVLRIIVPDAEAYLRAYCRDDDEGYRQLGVPDPYPSDLPTRMDIINHVFHQWHEHRWGYDFETLEHRLKSVGFDRIERKGFQDSIHEKLGNDREEHAPYSLYVEAVK